MFLGFFAGMRCSVYTYLISRLRFLLVCCLICLIVLMLDGLVS